MASKITIVHPLDWLEEDGSIPTDPRLRARALRLAQFIEAGGPLGRGFARETLIACRRRPAAEPCAGVLWVLKQGDDAIQAFCPACGHGELLIHGWERTRWAAGPQAPIDVAARKQESAVRPEPPAAVEPTQASVGPPAVPGETREQRIVARILAQLGSSLAIARVVELIRSSERPTEVVHAILASMSQPPTQASLERLLEPLLRLWNSTPRPELDEASPDTVRRRAVESGSAAAEPAGATGRDAPCPCGSGNTYEDCCMDRKLH